MRNLDKGLGTLEGRSVLFLKLGYPLRYAGILGISGQNHRGLTEPNHCHQRKIVFLNGSMSRIVGHHLAGFISFQTCRIDPHLTKAQIKFYVGGDFLEIRPCADLLHRLHHVPIISGIAHVIRCINRMHGIVTQNPVCRADMVIVIVCNNQIINGINVVFGQLSPDERIIVVIGGIHQDHLVIHTDQNTIGFPRV